jgi:hypothetical protein
MKRLYMLAAAMLQTICLFAQITSNFDSLKLAPESYWNGSDLSGGFTNGNAFFENSYVIDPIYGNYWSGGFSYSDMTDTTTAGYTNMYSAYRGSGVGHSSNYAVVTTGAVVHLLNEAKTTPVTGFYLTNSTYAALSMKYGDSFAKKFGGPTGTDPDWFQLAITGYANNSSISDTVKIMLADYRFTDTLQDYILSTWRWVDLRPLGTVDSLIFLLTSSDTGPYGMNTPAYFDIDNFNEPMYDPAIENGSTLGIYKNSPLFKSWATSCTVTRGYMNIDDQVLGLASAGVDSNAIGKSDDITVSLGDSGIAIIQFAVPIQNGSGPDFAVFENGFNITGGSEQYLELGFVEVSSDGVHYVRFPAVSKTNAETQVTTFGGMDASLLYNLAGKYVVYYGTPFDLDELKNNPDIDVNNIEYVKIIDVIGTIDIIQSTKDSLGNPVDDPFPTPFASSGFDLDAVGVINQNNLATSITTKANNIEISVYPNPSSGLFQISLLNRDYLGDNLNVYDAGGNMMMNQVLTETSIVVDASAWQNGIYFVKVGNTSQKLVKMN